VDNNELAGLPDLGNALSHDVQAGDVGAQLGLSDNFMHIRLSNDWLSIS